MHTANDDLYKAALHHSAHGDIHEALRLLTELGRALGFSERRPAVRVSGKSAVDTAQSARAVKAESEFYVEVKDALVAEGRAEHVAASLIDTEQKLLAQARRLEII